MTLLEIRMQFAKLSGRYDLVTGAFADNGADYFIKAGLKFLDRRAEFDKDLGKFFSTPAAGDFFAEVPSNRTIEKVWFATSSGGRWELTYLTPTELQTLYGTEAYSDVDRGAPVHYTRSIIRGIPDNTALDDIGNYNSEIAVDGSQISKVGIIFMPPTDTAGQIEVWGKYNTPWPASDAGTNFWFTNFEDVAVAAALYKLEVSYRNTQGAADWLAAIDLDILGIDRDLVESEASNADQMEN